MLTATKTSGRPLKHKRLCRVRVKLCGFRCTVCNGGHEFTEPLDAERIDARHVRITQPDDVWFGAVINDSDYEFCA